jgi:hypothetical protein
MQRMLFTLNYPILTSTFKASRRSPIRAALRNLNSQNSALELNVKNTSKRRYRFIHGKGTALTQDQAASLKERLVEMDNSPEKSATEAALLGIGIYSYL